MIQKPFIGINLSLEATHRIYIFSSSLYRSSSFTFGSILLKGFGKRQTGFPQGLSQRPFQEEKSDLMKEDQKMIDQNVAQRLPDYVKVKNEDLSESSSTGSHLSLVKQKLSWDHWMQEIVKEIILESQVFFSL